MRTKILTTLAAGTIGLAGLAVAAPPVLAASGASSAATAVSSQVEHIKAALAGLVTDGTLTQAQADKVATTLDAADLHGGRNGRHGGMGGGHDLATAATVLGVSEADLRTALRDGKTLAAVAGEKNVPVDTLIAKLVEAAKTRIAQDVTDGRLTQAQADAKLANLTARITERVNSSRPGFPRGERGSGGMRGAAPSTTPTAAPSS